MNDGGSLLNQWNNQRLSHVLVPFFSATNEAVTDEHDVAAAMDFLQGPARYAVPVTPPDQRKLAASPTI
jgi:hypothetical protein